MDTFRSPDPSPDGDSRLGEVRAMAARVDATLRTSEALLRAARQVDLRGLDTEVGRLCAASLDLSPDQGRVMRHTLAELMARLDTLEAALRLPAP